MVGGGYSNLDEPVSLSFVQRLPNEQRQDSTRPRVRAGVEQSSTLACDGV
jgi:hypothetical protein